MFVLSVFNGIVCSVSFSTRGFSIILLNRLFTTVFITAFSGAAERLAAGLRDDDVVF